jgi:O-succinylhomoserine sulfhydrylase
MKDAPGARTRWKPRTRAVHAGTRRSQYGEVSEALFLTQGFVYDTPRRPRRASRGGIRTNTSTPATATRPSRCSRTASRALEGAPDAFATASGMAAVHGALLCHAARGRPRGRGAGAVRLLPLHRRGAAAALRRRGRPSSTAPISTQWRAAVRPDTKAGLLRDALQPDARGHRHRRVSPRSPMRPARGWWSTTSSPRRCSSARSALGADVVIYSATKHIDGQGRVLGGVMLGPAASSARAGALHEAHRRGDEPVQRLGDAEIARDAGPALPRAGGGRAGGRRGAGGASGAGAA